MFLIKKRISADNHYRTVTLPNWQKQPPETFHKKAVHKNFAIFTGKHLATLLKRDSKKNVFMWILQNLFWRIPILKNIHRIDWFFKPNLGLKRSYHPPPPPPLVPNKFNHKITQPLTQSWQNTRSLSQTSNSI